MSSPVNLDRHPIPGLRSCALASNVSHLGADSLHCMCPLRLCAGLNCSAGRWTNAEQSASCAACPAGTFSSSGANACQPCAAGRFSTTNSSTCPVCPVGRYTPLTGRGECSECAAGRFGGGVDPTTDCGNCSVGQFRFADSGVLQLLICLPPSSCIAVTEMFWSYYYADSASGAGSCSPCAPGRFSGTVSAPSCDNCTAGLYSLGNASSCLLCPSGTYGSVAQTSSQCSGNCSAGYFCPAGSVSQTQAECPPGQYSLPGAGACSLCVSGRFGNASRLGTALCSGLCPAGRFGDTPGLVNWTCSGQCTPGRYCPEGSVDMLKCAAGKWSATFGRGSPCVDDCDAGYLCSAGSSSSQPQVCGGPRLYCPAGTPAALSVDVGHYSNGGVSPDTRTSQAACPPPWDAASNFSGVYCPGPGDGNIHLCPGGVFGDTSGLVSPACSGPCSAGYYCPPGSVNSTARACGSVGLYCPSGVGAPVSVPVGFYSLPELESRIGTRESTISCQQGEYCVGGTRFLCSGGTYSTVFGRSTPCSDACLPGTSGSLRASFPVFVFLLRSCPVFANMSRVLLPEWHGTTHINHSVLKPDDVLPSWCGCVFADCHGILRRRYCF